MNMKNSNSNSLGGDPMVTMMEVSTNVSVSSVTTSTSIDQRRALNGNATLSNGDPMDADISLTVIPGSDDELDDDDDDDGLSTDSGHSVYATRTASELMAAAMDDDITAQLAAAGPVGMAAAAAIVSAKKRKRPHSFETNPSIRKRQQNRLLRKLRQTIDEFSTRVGQQAVVLVATPGKENSGFKCFGAKPLEDVMKNLRNMIMEELEHALSQHAPPPIPDDPTLYELPPLILDGIPTPVEKMTQAQLRAFIPLMLKYSTGRGKPGWGRESTRPAWWPKDLPWANVRMDARTEQEKQKISWTKALRQIVINCYKFHGREDLLPVFTEEDEIRSCSPIQTMPPTIPPLTSISNPSNPSNATSVLKYTSSIKTCDRECEEMIGDERHTQVTQQYAPTVLQTINNADGTVSIIHVDQNTPIITLPDGTTAHVQGVLHNHHHQGENGTVHAVQSLTDQGEVSVDFNNVGEAINQDGQLILTNEEGYPVSVSGMLTAVSGNPMYQTVVANIQHINNDGSVSVTPILQVPKLEPCTVSMDSNGNHVIHGESQNMETITMPQHQVFAVGSANGSQVLQVISLKDPNTLKALAAAGVSVANVPVTGTNVIEGEMKHEEPPTITGDN